MLLICNWSISVQLILNRSAKKAVKTVQKSVKIVPYFVIIYLRNWVIIQCSQYVKLNPNLSPKSKSNL